MRCMQYLKIANAKKTHALLRGHALTGYFSGPHDIYVPNATRILLC